MYDYTLQRGRKYFCQSCLQAFSSKEILKSHIKNYFDLVKKKGFHPFEYMTDFENFREKLPSVENFCSSLTSKKINDNIL